MKNRVVRQVSWLGLAAVLAFGWTGCAEEETETVESGEESSSGEGSSPVEEDGSGSAEADGEAAEADGEELEPGPAFRIAIAPLLSPVARS